MLPSFHKKTARKICYLSQERSIPDLTGCNEERWIKSKQNQNINIGKVITNDKPAFQEFRLIICKNFDTKIFQNQTRVKSITPKNDFESFSGTPDKEKNDRVKKEEDHHMDKEEGGFSQ